MEFNNRYRIDLRELNFLLWEQLDIENTLLDAQANPDVTKEFIQDILFQARDFAYKELGPNYQRADREGCTLAANGSVHLPTKYGDIWQKYVDAQWGRLGCPSKYEGLAAPFVVNQVVNEIFQGADPSFMVYPGFCTPAVQLIERYGTAETQNLFCHKLATNAWTACLCMTEPQAGSDVGAITTKAVQQENGSYHIDGGKIFISGGMHDLTENIVCIVLARVKGAPSGTRGLSCFIVPRLDIGAKGTLVDNNVRCVGLEDKMGIHGCATAQLRFGEGGACRGYLLGTRENVGLTQLFSMMQMARISTGIYALGLAGRAYMSAIEYAEGRVQGTSFKYPFATKAKRVSIISHIDVRRMLLEMKSKVEGCRALIHKLTFHQSVVHNFQNPGNTGTMDIEIHNSTIRRNQALVDLLTPVAKSYVSDQAWRIAELAIQVFGGYGYIKDNPVEQVARDAKILSIWEGTSFMQSADLVRDKLAMGGNSRLLDAYKIEIEAMVDHNRRIGAFAVETDALEAALDTFQRTLGLIGAWVADGQLELVFGVSTRLLEMLAEVTLSWLLLEGAVVAKKKLQALADPEDEAFYKGKIASAEFYINNILPGVKSKAEIIANTDTSALNATADIFLRRSQMYQ